MRFERAKIGDCQEIISLFHGLIGVEGCTWSLEYPTLEIVKGDIEREEMYVLREGNAIVAAALSGIITHGGYENFFVNSHLKNARDFARIGVARHLIGKGVGSVLMYNLIEDAKAHGADGAHLLVSPTNPSAIALYNKFGFKRIEQVIFYDEPWISMELVF